MKKTQTTTERKHARNNHQPVGQWIRKERRLAIYLRDHFLCLHCGRDLADADPRDITLDHIRAKADGGTNHEGNLCCSCRACNCARQDKPISRFDGPEARAHIRRNAKRSLKPYLRLAKSLISGETGFEETLRLVNGGFEDALGHTH